MAINVVGIHIPFSSGQTATETVHALQAAGLPVYTLQKMGNDRENLVLLLLGDGYTQDQQQQFLQEAREQLRRLMALEPYSRLAHRINVYAVPAVSNEAGLSSEDNKLDTYFGLTTRYETKTIVFRNDVGGAAKVDAIRADLERLCLDEGAFVDNIHMFVNTGAKVGSAHGIYSFSKGGAEDYAMAHELSHSVGKLGDEYGYATDFPNVSGTDNIKWKEMMGYRSIIAEPGNASGVLIPTKFKCNMYQSDLPFCEVCRLALVRRMFATGKIQNGMDLYVADPEVTTEHKPYMDSAPYRVTQENLMEKAKDIHDLSLRTVIQNLSDQERTVKLVLGVVKANGEPRQPLKEQTFTVPALTNKDSMEDACIYPTLTFDPIWGMDFKDGDRLVGEVRDAENGEVLATCQEPEYDAYQVDYLLEDGQPIPNTFPTKLLLPKGCTTKFIEARLPQRVGGHAFVRMEREGLALRLYYRQTVPPEKPELKGGITILGTPKYGQTLTVDVSKVEPAGATLTYQWYRGNDEYDQIKGATAKTYTLTAEDIGKKISVKTFAEGCEGVLVTETADTVAKADAPKNVKYDVQVWYANPAVQTVTVDVFKLPKSVEGAAIQDGAPTKADEKNIISTADFTSTTFKLADGLTPADAGKTASWTVTITSKTHGDTTGTVTVTVTADAPVVPKPEPKPEPSQPGGGGSGGGGGGSAGGGGSSSGKPSTSTGKTETATKPDGTKVETVTKPDGTTVKTETKKDGSVSKTETKTETKPDGTKVETKNETVTNKDGSKVETRSEVKTDKNGVTSGTETTKTITADGSTGTTVTTTENGEGKTVAETTLSGKAVEDAKKNGEAVKAPVEVEATKNSSTAPTVKVELPKGAGETKVEIPVSNVKPGTVAVLVHPDGTEEILKDSIPTEDGIRLTVDGGATVKIVDNSKDFADTRNHWAKDAIDFVSARGLVNGMNDSIYAPNNSTTRAQLWTILARQNDADLTGGNTWYESAQNWAKAKGVSDGANPNGTINRAQMVTMLWRAVGQPAVGGAATFTDVSADSYYAQAVAWAVENGITTGVGGGRFDPNATCTRAQIAAFLARSMK